MALHPTNERLIDYDDETRDMPGLLCQECNKMYSLGGIDNVIECLVNGTYVIPLFDNLCICDDNISYQNKNNIVLYNIIVCTNFKQNIYKLC